MERETRPWRIGRRHVLIASAALVVAVVLAAATSALPGRATAHATSASTGTSASTPSPLTFSHVPNSGIQAILDAHPHETVIIDGTGFRPESPIPGSGSCAQAPAQSTTFDRTRLSAAELDYYGLPPRPTGAEVTTGRMAAWESAVRNQRHRVCTSRSVFDPQTG